MAQSSLMRNLLACQCNGCANPYGCTARRRACTVAGPTSVALVTSRLLASYHACQCDRCSMTGCVVRRKRYDPTAGRQLRQRYEAGETIADLAYACGAAPSTVRHRLAVEGAAIRHPGGRGGAHHAAPRRRA